MVCVCVCVLPSISLCADPPLFSGVSLPECLSGVFEFKRGTFSGSSSSLLQGHQVLQTTPQEISSLLGGKLGERYEGYAALEATSALVNHTLDGF